MKKLLEDIDCEKLSEELKKDLETAQGQKRVHILKRLEVVESFRISGNRPEWMILDAVPVIPPDIRPLVQLDGGRFATTGDGQLTAAQLLSILKQREAKLSSLKTVMERYPQTMVNIKVSPEGKLAFHTDPKVKKAIQQATATLNGEGSVIVRPSGTEPLLSFMVEGRDLALIEKLANDISEVIKEELV